MSVSMTLPQLRRHECTIDGRRVHLQPAVADFLALLLVSPPARVVPFSTISDALWGEEGEEPLYADKIVQVYVCWLRRLGITIETRRRYGYRIPVEASGTPEEQRLAA